MSLNFKQRSLHVQKKYCQFKVEVGGMHSSARSRWDACIKVSQWVGAETRKKRKAGPQK
jgi:hypothetical protein